VSGTIEDEESEEESDVHRQEEGRATLSRVIDLVVDSTRRPSPINAVQEHASPIKSKFWAQSNDPDLDDDDVPSTPELINQAQAAGFTLHQLMVAEKALDSGNLNPSSSDIRLAKSIVSKLIQTKTVVSPWKGPLPPPRISPPRTLGDAIAKAAILIRSQ